MLGADAVFVGTILDMAYPPARPWAGDSSQMVISGGDRVTCLVRLEHSWKGSWDTVNVYTASDDAACGYHFEVGSRYLIYGSWRDSLHLYRSDPHGLAAGPLLPPGLITGLCSRTCHITEALYDLHELGQPVRSVRASPLPDASVDALLGYLQSEDNPFFWSAAKALSSLLQETEAVVEAMRRMIHTGARFDQLRAIWMLQQLGPLAMSALPDLNGILGRVAVTEEDEYLVSQAKRAVESIRGPIIAPQGRHMYE
jgi:hypothetical protein